MSAISTVENCMYQANIVLPVKRLLEAPGDFRDDVKKSMSEKKLIPLVWVGGGKTPIHFPYPTLILFKILLLFTKLLL